MESLELCGIPIEAISIGGIETCIHLPSFKVAFDIGRCPPEVVRRDTVLLTHPHMDHMGGIAFHCATRGLRGMRPPKYIVPRNEVDAFEGLFDAWRVLDRSQMLHTTIPAAPGEEIELPGRIVVRPFTSPHSAPCLGYSLWTRKNKLKPRYRGLAGDELARLRNEGVEVTDCIETPEVAFPGDTMIEVMEREEVCRKARLLILETTFLDDKISVQEARSKGHVHLDEVVAHAELFENEAILMTHFSSRYKAAEIRSRLDEKLPPSLKKRVVPLLGAH